MNQSFPYKVEVPIMDNLSILACRTWKICWEIEMNVYKHKDEEESQIKRIFFPKNEYFTKYKRGFFIEPILIS